MTDISETESILSNPLKLLEMVGVKEELCGEIDIPEDFVGMTEKIKNISLTK